MSIVEDIDISKIQLANQLRKDYFYTIPELVDSIRKVGLLQPVIVRMSTDRHFEIVSGCRRYTACKELGWKEQSPLLDENGNRRRIRDEPSIYLLFTKEPNEAFKAVNETFGRVVKSFCSIYR